MLVRSDTRASRLALPLFVLGALCGCEGDSGGEQDSDVAYLDVEGTVGGYTVRLMDHEVSFSVNGDDDSLISFLTPDNDENLTLSLDLAGHFTEGTHVIGADYGDAWDSSIAGGSVAFYDDIKDLGWAARSSEFSEQHSPLTFEVSRSDSRELVGKLRAALLPDEGTQGTLEAALDVRVHGFSSGHNRFGGPGSGTGSTCKDDPSTCPDGGVSSGAVVGHCLARNYASDGIPLICIDYLSGAAAAEATCTRPLAIWAAGPCPSLPWAAHCNGYTRDGTVSNRHWHPLHSCEKGGATDQLSQNCKMYEGDFKGDDCGKWFAEHP